MNNTFLPHADGATRDDFSDDGELKMSSKERKKHIQGARSPKHALHKPKKTSNEVSHSGKKKLDVPESNNSIYINPSPLQDDLVNSNNDLNTSKKNKSPKNKDPSSSSGKIPQLKVKSDKAVEQHRITQDFIAEQQDLLDNTLVQVDKTTAKAVDSSEKALVAAEEAKAVKASVEEVMKSFFRKYPHAPRQMNVRVW